MELYAVAAKVKIAQVISARPLIGQRTFTSVGQPSLTRLPVFIEAGKPVFVIEYKLTPEEFCFQARDMKFSALQTNWELDAYRFSCS